MQEVSKFHSSLDKKSRRRKEPRYLNPNYIVGFVDGEGCFCVGISKRNDTRKPEIRAIFEIELRIDDQDILKRIQTVFGCGQIYELYYERYSKWAPHVKYKVSNIKDISQKVVPFFKQHPLQAKKRETFKLFIQIVKLIVAKKHLTDRGYNRIVILRNKMRQIGKKSRNR